MSSDDDILFALFILRVVGPALLLLIAASVLFLRSSNNDTAQDSNITSVIVAIPQPRRALILSLLTLAALTYFLDAVAVALRAVIDKTWDGGTQQWRHIETSDVLGFVAFAGIAALGTWKDVRDVPIWTRQRLRLFAALSVAFDVVQVVLLAINPPKARGPEPGNPKSIAPYDLLHLAFPVFRLLVTLPLYPALAFPRTVYAPAHVPAHDDIRQEEAAPLLHAPTPQPSTGLNPASAAEGYGTFRSSAPTRTHTPALSDSAPPHTSHHSESRLKTLPDPKASGEISLEPSWSEILARLRRIVPYLWPSGSAGLQSIAVLCALIIIAGRFVNPYLPLTLGRLVKALDERNSSPWPYLWLYAALWFLKSPGGLPAFRDILWAPVMQYSDRSMSQMCFDHLLNLSLAFHTRRKTGEVLRILDRGAAINRIFELLLFNVVPIFLDVIVALVVFWVRFDWTLSVLVFAVFVSYVTASVLLTTYRTRIRRQMNDKDVITRGIHTDCLLNYETVKYFNGEEHEGERYREAIRQYQVLEYKVMVSLNLLNLVQNLISGTGLLVGSLMVASRIVDGRFTGSDFVVFITYLQQLYGPLNMLGSIYRTINQALVDTERLLKLLTEPTEITDAPNAKGLIVDRGSIVFENVTFSYDGKVQALRNVSFTVPPGSSVALVGETGSGKSTILRLLYRFYDLKKGEGHITIDGQDIRDITQNSLRRAIGVVPQDSVLFNHSIGYNIGYGKFGADAEEIEAAAKAAQMHDRIVSFPDGYETKVGERGVRLSGGEKQRVAIARTLLKNPPILLLDEATSALDTSTEKDIQKALHNLQQGRSSLSIAHRLSTIASADLILVLKDGQIVEQGSLRELLDQNGVFATMWADQVSADERAQSVVGHKEEVSGYSVGEDTKEVEPETSDNVQALSGPGPVINQELPQPVSQTEINKEPRAAQPGAPSFAAVASGQSKSTDATDAPSSSAPIAFPSSDDQDDPSQSTELPPSQPGVTFEPVLESPTGRDDAAPSGEPRRKRISSQNLSKFARKLSLVGRRQSSSGSAVQATVGGASKASNHSPRPSVAGESPTASLSESRDESKGRKKKSKKSTSTSGKA